MRLAFPPASTEATVASSALNCTLGFAVTEVGKVPETLPLKPVTEALRKAVRSTVLAAEPPTSKMSIVAASNMGSRLNASAMLSPLAVPSSIAPRVDNDTAGMPLTLPAKEKAMHKGTVATGTATIAGVVERSPINVATYAAAEPDDTDERPPALDDEVTFGRVDMKSERGGSFRVGSPLGGGAAWTAVTTQQKRVAAVTIDSI